MSNNGFRVYTRWVAYELRKKGFKIIDTDINEYHPQFTVWIFEETKEFLQAFEQISKSRKRS